MNEYEAHLSSYDHSHKQRMKDMKAMVRDPTAAARARKQEAKADGVISIKLGEGGGGTVAAAGFKKGAFKKTGFKSAFGPASEEADPVQQPDGTHKVADADSNAAVPNRRLVESDTEDEGYDMYDPRYPTD